MGSSCGTSNWGVLAKVYRLPMQDLVCRALTALHRAMNRSPVPCGIRVFAGKEYGRLNGLAESLRNVERAGGK